MADDLLKCSRALSRGEKAPHGEGCACLVAEAGAQAVAIGLGENQETGAIQLMAVTLAFGILGPKRMAELLAEKGKENGNTEA